MKTTIKSLWSQNILKVESFFRFEPRLFLVGSYYAGHLFQVHWYRLITNHWAKLAHFKIGTCTRKTLGFLTRGYSWNLQIHRKLFRVKPKEIMGTRYLYSISCPNLNQTKSPTNFHNINWIQDSSFHSNCSMSLLKVKLLCSFLSVLLLHAKQMTNG